MLGFLDQHARQYVRVIGEQFGLAEDVASKNLQLLASGGFLTAERVGRYLFYSLSDTDELLRSVLVGMRNTRGDVNPLIRTLTALTHERRVAIIAALSKESLETNALCSCARMSGPAAERHLDKLVRRGWVAVHENQCKLNSLKTPLERVLIESATEYVTLAQV